MHFHDSATIVRAFLFPGLCAMTEVGCHLPVVTTQPNGANLQELVHTSQHSRVEEVIRKEIYQKSDEGSCSIVFWCHLKNISII